MSFFCESFRNFINFKYCMLCLKLTCLILLKYHMQYIIAKKCRFCMSCVCFYFSKHFESTTHFLVNSFEFEQYFPMRVQTFGAIAQHCIMYIHFAIFRNFTPICCISKVSPGDGDARAVSQVFATIYYSRRYDWSIFIWGPVLLQYS